jgi:hypothetical protein
VPEQPGRLKPLDPPMVPFALAGIGVWAIVALVLIPFRDTHGDWLRISIAGVLVGIPGLAMMLVHDANRRRRRASQ